MTRRIFHAGVTTSELLSMYISVICAFKALDPRGVLLDKVAAPLRAYLRQRDDTVRIIAASFLADVDNDGKVITPSDDVCSDLAREISLSEGEEMKVDAKGLDWDDMTWLPDPIDAGPGTCAPKSSSGSSLIRHQTTKSRKATTSWLSCSNCLIGMTSFRKYKHFLENVCSLQTLLTRNLIKRYVTFVSTLTPVLETDSWHKDPVSRAVQDEVRSRRTTALRGHASRHSRINTYQHDYAPLGREKLSYSRGNPRCCT